MPLEAVVLAVGGAFLSSFLNVLLDRLATVEVRESLINFSKNRELSVKNLQELEMSLLTVNKVLGDAEEKQIMNPSVKKWLDKLKDAAYDAEDLLDAIGFGGLLKEKQVKDFNTRLEQIVSKLKLVVNEKDILSLKEGQGRKPISSLPTTSFVDESEVCFRDNDKKRLLDILLSDGVDRKGIPVIAILGMGGIGKTSLAQFLYNDVRVNNHFNLRAWVYVSEEFDVFKVTKAIYESATLSHSDIEDLNALQVKLARTLMGRKFLLVLDNIWNESSKEWELLRRPLQVGAAGSKIIVTTRSQSVSSAIHDALVHNLKLLPKDDCWSLFAKHAFGDKGADEDSTLKGIGEKIVEKCKRLPLAIKTLGSLLYSEAEALEWNNVLNSRIWDLPDHKSDILPALRLSYHYLPSQLKRCFAYCSIFPKRHKFEKGDLVRMWIAEGLVHQPNNSRSKQEIGEQYFHALLSRSIFQQSNDPSRFIMHDLVNDLAQHIAGEFCFKFEHDSSPQNPARVRHLSCMLRPGDTPHKFEAFYENNKVLRTFLPLRSPSGGKTPFDSRVFKKLFPATSCLRVLSLSPYNITEFPDSVGKLKQLRYLDLSGAAIQNLPETVDSLHNLETLKLSGCYGLTLLPMVLSRLTKLEHLDIKGTRIRQMPLDFGKLKRLQLLTNFVVGKVRVSTISELKDLSLLRGTLSISGLENVSQTADAEMANLKDKKYLRELIFDWNVDPCDHGTAQNAVNDPPNGNTQNAQSAKASLPSSNGRSAAEAEKVLDKLQPGENLKRLVIKNFFGTMLPEWLGNASFSNMKSLTLKNSQNCNSLPPLGQLPSLQSLYINKCPALESLPKEGLPSSLVILCISFCDKITPQKEWNLDKLHSLSRFEIEGGCQDLKSFPEVGLLPTNLNSLRISGLVNLTFLDTKGLERLTSLQTLEINCCNKLDSLPEHRLPSSLSSLSITGCSLLNPKLQNRKGEEWLKIAHIPSIHLDEISGT